MGKYFEYHLSGITLLLIIYLFFSPIFISNDRSTRKNVLQLQFYFDCKCLACENNYPMLNMLPSGTVPFDYVNIFNKKNIYTWPEKDAIIIYDNACQYLVNHGNAIVNRKMVMVQEVLRRYFFVLMNNWSRTISFKDFKMANCILQRDLHNI